MTPYEAAMKRVSLEAIMAAAMERMWWHAEYGFYEIAMQEQFDYLMARDEWGELYWGKPQAQEYWAMYDATNGKRKSIYD